MAPTETLAEQHHRTLDSLLGGTLPVELLTGSTSAARRRELLDRLANGQLQLVVGTHALIEDAGGVPRPRGGRGGRAAPLRRAPARGARREGAGRARAARAPHDRHADPAHALADRVRRPRRDGPARAAARAAAGRDATWSTAPARVRARTSASARRSPPGGSASSSARWSRSRRRSRPRRPPPSSSACARPSSRDQRVELIHGQMPSKQKAAAMETFAARRGRRARGHQRDRGGHRRAERHRDADRGGRALRPLAAAPAPRPGGARRARVALHPVRRPDAAASRGDRQRARRLPARRGRPRAARRRRRARHAPARPARVPGGAAAGGRRAARARARPRGPDPDRGSRASRRRSTRCCARRWWHASARSSTRSRHERDHPHARPRLHDDVARGPRRGRAARARATTSSGSSRITPREPSGTGPTA